MRIKNWLLLGEAEEGKDLPGAPTPQESADSPVEDIDIWDTITAEIDEYAEPAEAPEAASEPEAVVEPEVEPVPAEPAVVPELPEAPAAPAMTVEEVDAAREGFRAALEKHYAFSEEDTLAIQTEPEKILPKMAARLHQEVMDNVMQQVYRIMPNVVQGLQKDTAREEQAKGEFYGAWPQLKGQEDKVLRMGAMFRQLNPGASAQEAIQQIGKLTMLALGQEVPAVAQGAREVPAPKFQPAAPGRVAAPASAKNEWQELIDLDDD